MVSLARTLGERGMRCRQRPPFDAMLLDLHCPTGPGSISCASSVPPRPHARFPSRPDGEGEDRI